MRFKKSKMYKKGQVGEQIVDDLILNAGKFIPYAPVLDNAHVFDRLIASTDKRKLMIIEIKAVDARDYYPDTGISIGHCKEYKYIQDKYNIDIWILFVDSKLKKIYGNSLNKLIEKAEVEHGNKLLKYPKIKPNFSAVGGKIIYFPLINMVDISELTDEQCKELKKFNNKGYTEGISWKKGYDEWLENKFSVI